MSTPSPSNVGHGAEEERGKEAEEDRDKATKTVKAEAGEDGGAFININIKVHSCNTDDGFFRIKRNVKLRQLIDMYCGKHSLHHTDVMFLDPMGRPIRRNQTPDELGLEDGSHR